MNRATCVLAALLFCGAGSAKAAMISVGASSDDWGDPAIGLSGDPTDGFLRIFGTTNDPNFPIRRGAMEFDISGVTAGSTVTSATLFFADRGSTATAQMQLHGYTGDGLVQTADLNDATFLSFFDTDDTDPDRNFNIDVTAFVQALVSGNAAFAGFMLRATTEGPIVFNGADFASSEYFDPAAHPLLTVEFAPAAVPEPGSLALLAAASVGVFGWRRRKAG